MDQRNKIIQKQSSRLLFLLDLHEDLLWTFAKLLGLVELCMGILKMRKSLLNILPINCHLRLGLTS